jgi:hypothetical protein
MAIYIQKFPEDAPHMLKYMSTIKNIYEMKGNESIRYYDETFRLLRKANSQPWQQEIDELYRKAMFMKSSKFTVNHNFPQPPTTAKYNNGTAINPNNRRVQPFLDTNNNGTCHIYNKYQCCTKRNCPYQHVCRVCKGPHPQAKCTKQATIHQINQPHTNKILPSPVNPEVLARELQGYKKDLFQTNIDGFTFGFKLGMEGDKSHGTCTRISKNHKSAIENPAKVYQKLAKESLLNRITGPFKTPPLKNLVYSPLGLVPKNVPDKFRLIYDLSYPKGNSVNSLIPQENSTVKYDGIDTVIQLVKQFGRHCKLSKCDIEDAFRIIPIHPSDYYLLGFTWNNYF